jgi:fructose-bisphosphate aldolase class I
MFDLVPRYARPDRAIKSLSQQITLLGPFYSSETMDRLIGGLPAADYLWKTRGVVPFLKVDKGLAAEYRWGEPDETL